MPPNSLIEWILGQNIPPTPKPRSSRPKNRRLLKVEVSRDDGSESDTLSVTYPVRTKHKKKSPTTAAPKQVRFIEVPKSALRHPRIILSSADEAGESDTDSDTLFDSDSDEDEAKEFVLQDESENDTSAVKKTKHKVHTHKCSKVESEEDAEPQGACQSPKCIAARRSMKKKAMRKTAKVENEASEQSNDDSESEAARQSYGKKNKKGKNNNHGNCKHTGRNKHSSNNKVEEVEETTEETTEAEVIQAEPTEAEGVPEVKSKKQGKANKKNEQKKTPTTAKAIATTPPHLHGRSKQARVDDCPDTPVIKLAVPSDEAKLKELIVDTCKAVVDAVSRKNGEDDAIAKMSRPSKFEKTKKTHKSSTLQVPEAWQGSRARSQSFQVEHIFENSTDPRPNAFIDHRSGIARVYHRDFYDFDQYRTYYPPQQPRGQLMPPEPNVPYNNGYNSGYNHGDNGHLMQHGGTHQPNWNMPQQSSGNQGRRFSGGGGGPPPTDGPTYPNQHNSSNRRPSQHERPTSDTNVGPAPGKPGSDKGSKKGSPSGWGVNLDDGGSNNAAKECFNFDNTKDYENAKHHQWGSHHGSQNGRNQSSPAGNQAWNWGQATNDQDNAGNRNRSGSHKTPSPVNQGSGSYWDTVPGFVKDDSPRGKPNSNHGDGSNGGNWGGGGDGANAWDNVDHQNRNSSGGRQDRPSPSNRWGGNNNDGQNLGESQPNGTVDQQDPSAQQSPSNPQRLASDSHSKRSASDSAPNPPAADTSVSNPAAPDNFASKSPVTQSSPKPSVQDATEVPTDSPAKPSSQTDKSPGQQAGSGGGSNNGNNNDNGGGWWVGGNGSQAGSLKGSKQGSANGDGNNNNDAGNGWPWDGNGSQAGSQRGSRRGSNNGDGNNNNNADKPWIWDNAMNNAASPQGSRHGSNNGDGNTWWANNTNGNGSNRGTPPGGRGPPTIASNNVGPTCGSARNSQYGGSQKAPSPHPMPGTYPRSRFNSYSGNIHTGSWSGGGGNGAWMSGAGGGPPDQGEYRPWQDPTLAQSSADPAWDGNSGEPKKVSRW